MGIFLLSRNSGFVLDNLLATVSSLELTGVEFEWVRIEDCLLLGGRGGGTDGLILDGSAGGAD